MAGPGKAAFARGARPENNPLRRPAQWQSRQGAGDERIGRLVAEEDEVLRAEDLVGDVVRLHDRQFAPVEVVPAALEVGKLLGHEPVDRGREAGPDRRHDDKRRVEGLVDRSGEPGPLAMERKRGRVDHAPGAVERKPDTGEDHGAGVGFRSARLVLDHRAVDGDPAAGGEIAEMQGRDVGRRDFEARRLQRTHRVDPRGRTVLTKAERLDPPRPAIGERRAGPVDRVGGARPAGGDCRLEEGGDRRARGIIVAVLHPDADLVRDLAILGGERRHHDLAGGPLAVLLAGVGDHREIEEISGHRRDVGEEPEPRFPGRHVAGLNADEARGVDEASAAVDSAESVGAAGSDLPRPRSPHREAGKHQPIAVDRDDPIEGVEGLKDVDRPGSLPAVAVAAEGMEDDAIVGEKLAGLAGLLPEEVEIGITLAAAMEPDPHRHRLGAVEPLRHDDPVGLRRAVDPGAVGQRHVFPLAPARPPRGELVEPALRLVERPGRPLQVLRLPPLAALQGIGHRLGKDLDLGPLPVVGETSKRDPLLHRFESLGHPFPGKALRVVELGDEVSDRRRFRREPPLDRVGPRGSARRQDDQAEHAQPAEGERSGGESEGHGDLRREVKGGNPTPGDRRQAGESKSGALGPPAACVATPPPREL